MKKKKILAPILTFILVLIGVSMVSSCGVLRDPSFREGFRQGWNQTAPEQYRY